MHKVMQTNKIFHLALHKSLRNIPCPYHPLPKIILKKQSKMKEEKGKEKNTKQNKQKREQANIMETENMF